MIHMNINMEMKENQNPEPRLEDGEFIECFSVPLKELYTECQKLESQGFAIDGKVGSFAEGIEAASAWLL
jgi:ADP-ribose pyrophosphatase